MLLCYIVCLIVNSHISWLPQEKFFVNAHVGANLAVLSVMAIRGQLVQKFTADLIGSSNVSPYKRADNTSGKVTLSFEAAGRVVCFDASFFQTSKSSTVQESPFLDARVHIGAKGTNGDVVMDFSATRVSPERFFGCRTLKELGVGSVQVIADLMVDPTNYYINAHVGKSGTRNFNVAVRGQLEHYK